MPLSAPTELDKTHLLGSFACSHSSLTEWLRNRALKNHQEGARRCFVVCDAKAVVGYYALAAGSVAVENAPGHIRRNMPNPIPVAILARLAVHQDYEKQGIGSGLLKDAILRALAVSKNMGIRAMLAHAVDENAKNFYLRHGFVESPVDQLTVLLNLSKIA